MKGTPSAFEEAKLGGELATACQGPRAADQSAVGAQRLNVFRRPPMSRHLGWRTIKKHEARPPGGGDRRLSFAVLGPLLVMAEDAPVSIPLGRERAVLAQLIARVGRPVAVDVLVDGLWPDVPPKSAERTLHALVARLRGRLEPGRVARDQSVIVTSGRGYMLAVEAEWVDAQRFEAVVDRAVHDAVEGSELRAALGLWRGSAYDGFD